ncbi:MULTISPECIES: acyltransferase [unclassified Curtobacterium]|uniref:acyltransferase family protein n=1 Tax=unclassified Curtobacterium TaxID=257496 RepID=UPI000FA28757|nr:acyltransferase [Curtobacterium sp. JUb34]ROR29941.1 peptidoglycan/LPS O-acetylase OafA/YrhL [Curtobacterium sp. JUb34]
MATETRAAESAADPVAAAPRAGGRLEFPYLDGLRGLAALAVVFYHAYLFTGTTGTGPTELPWLRPIIGWGYLGVPLFIVLSGYVLMLPVLTRFDRYRLPGGFWKFVWRRARRIIPPYWASLVLFALLILFVPVLGQPGGTQWDTKLPMGWGTFLTHFFLVHDFFPQYIGKINGPMWTVAVEWQIYFLMPLLILPLWRVFGGWATASSLVLIGMWMGAESRYSFMHPWFVGLFAVGMLAAELTVKARDEHLSGVVRERSKLGGPRWASGAFVGAMVLGTLLVFFRNRDYWQHQTWPSEVVTGILAGILLTWMGRQAVTGNHTWLARFFAWKPFVLAGLVSYSIYLFHSPLLGLGNLLLLPLGLYPKYQFLMMVFVVIPVVIGICIGFWWLVERNFMNRRQKHATAEVSHRGRLPEVETDSASPDAGSRSAR